jgi:hypothetical protein
MTVEEIMFIEEQIEYAKQLAELDPPDQIASLCDQAGCDEKHRKAHSKAYLHRHWNPHPSDRFKRWWETEGYIEAEKRTERGWSVMGDDRKYHGINYVTAYNCEVVREIYRDFLKQQRNTLRRFKTDEIDF